MSENNTQVKFTFKKEEKLCSQTAIDKLFKEGSSFIAYPLRVVYSIDSESDPSCQHPSVLISVSKHKFKRANKRNRVKRLVREAYRLNKMPFIDLCQKQGISMNIAFLYLKNELPTFEEIEKSIRKTIITLVDKMEEKQ